MIILRARRRELSLAFAPVKEFFDEAREVLGCVFKRLQPDLEPNATRRLKSFSMARGLNHALAYIHMARDALWVSPRVVSPWSGFIQQAERV
jgi:hypothetical protein